MTNGTFGNRRWRQRSTPSGMDHAGLAMGLCLMSLALAALSLAGTKSWLLFGVVVLPAVLISAASLARIIYTFHVNVFSLVFFGTVLWYAGPLAAGAFPGSSVTLPPDSLIVTSLSVGLIATSLALVIVLYFCFPHPIASVSWPDVFIRERAARILVITASVLMLFLIVSGRWTFGSLSSNIEAEGKQILLGANFLAILVFPLSGALLANSLRRKRTISAETVIMAGCVVVALIWALVSGRRNFAVAVVLAAAGFLSVLWRNKPASTIIVQGAIAAVVGLVLVSAGWQTFFMMRYASYSLQKGADVPSLAEMYALSKAVDRREASAEYAKNLSSRGAIISSVSVVASNADGALLGEGALNSIIVVIPSVLFPGKSDWERRIGGSQELLWSMRINVPLNDWANTLFLDSYADFSVFGLPLYLLIVTGIFSSLRFVSRGDPFAEYMMVAGVLYALLNVEGGLSSLLVTMRNLLMVLLLWRFYIELVPHLDRSGRSAEGRRLPVVRT